MMNKTQKLIVLVGDQKLIRISLDTIRGFKAVTCVNQLTEGIIKNVFNHNKNVVYAQTVFDIQFNQYDPIVINISKEETNVDLMRINVDNVMVDFPMLLDKCNIDVGDHNSKDSKSAKAVKCNCLLCKIAKGEQEKPEHILYESDNFYVVPGLGAFFEGYIMIVPKRHVMSYAELNEIEYEEFLRVLNDMKFILESIYKKKIFAFECGSGRGGAGKHETSIVHAHFHLAPTDMPVLDQVHESGLNPALINSRDLSNYGQYPYMLYVDQEENWYISSDPDTYFPRQHPRQVLADYMQLEKGEYNWRTNPLREKMDVIAEEIYSFLRENFETLPKWIQKSVVKFIK